MEKIIKRNKEKLNKKNQEERKWKPKSMETVWK